MPSIAVKLNVSPFFCEIKRTKFKKFGKGMKI